MVGYLCAEIITKRVAIASLNFAKVASPKFAKIFKGKVTQNIQGACPRFLHYSAAGSTAAILREVTYVR